MSCYRAPAQLRRGSLADAQQRADELRPPPAPRELTERRRLAFKALRLAHEQGRPPEVVVMLQRALEALYPAFTPTC